MSAALPHQTLCPRAEVPNLRKRPRSPSCDPELGQVPCSGSPQGCVAWEDELGSERREGSPEPPRTGAKRRQVWAAPSLQWRRTSGWE